MFTELVRRGFVVAAAREPSLLREPTAYVNVPTTLAFSTPPVGGGTRKVGKANAKLGLRSKRNTKRKGRAKRIVGG